RSISRFCRGFLEGRSRFGWRLRDTRWFDGRLDVAAWFGPRLFNQGFYLELGILLFRFFACRPCRRAGLCAAPMWGASPAVVGATLLQVAVIGRLHIGHVQKTVAPDTEIHERCLNTRLNVDDAALVNIADVTLLTGAFDVQFFQNAILDNGDPAFLGLQDVN